MLRAKRVRSFYPLIRWCLYSLEASAWGETIAADVFDIDSRSDNLDIFERKLRSLSYDIAIDENLHMLVSRKAQRRGEGL